MRRLVVILMLASLGVGLWGPAPGGAAAPAGDYAPDQVLVQYRAGTTPAQQQAARQRAQATPQELVRAPAAGAGALELVALPGRVTVPAAIAALRADPVVEFAEPNWRLTRGPIIQATPDDRGFRNGGLWGMYGNVSPANCDLAGGCTNPYGSKATDAWAKDSVGNEASPVDVGVLDEGIRVDHDDLDANVWSNPYDPVDGVDNDGNGYVDDTNGWDFYNRDRTVYDGPTVSGDTSKPAVDNHGTHVAGTIGAEADNYTFSDGGTCPERPNAPQNGVYCGGLVGVTWHVRLISAKFLGPDGGYIADAVKAVDYLTDLKTRHGLNLAAINNSWGGGGYSTALHAAIIRAAKQNILFVVAAGNDGRNNDVSASYPCNYDTTKAAGKERPAGYDGVVCVAALASDGTIPWWTNRGSKTVDLGAPGVGIWSTVATPNGYTNYPYDNYSGTSMATPHVTGAVALYKAANPGATGPQLRDALLRGTVATPALAGITASGGRLDISCMLGLASCTR
jgi:hypothetical protein